MQLRTQQLSYQTPYELTAKAKKAEIQTHGSPHKIFEGIMEPEQILYLAVILQALSEQDEALVSPEHGGERGVQERKQASEAAREWLADETAMREMCEDANLPYEFLRKLTPEKAKDALERLLGYRERFQMEPPEEDKDIEWDEL